MPHFLSDSYENANNLRAEFAGYRLGFQHTETPRGPLLPIY
jgi:hypothetical protein